MTENPNPRIEALLDHSDWLRALARRLVADPASADDAVQDTYVVALDSAPRGLDERTGRAWLAGVLRNMVRMQRRGEGRRARRNATAARSEALPSTADVLAEVDLKQRLAEHVVKLPEPLRTTVLLRYHEGLSSAQIARAQGLAAGTVRWRLKRGLDLLREDLDEHHGSREAWLGGLVAFARFPAGAETSPAPPPAPLSPPVAVGSLAALAAGIVLAVAAARPGAHDDAQALEAIGSGHVAAPPQVAPRGDGTTRTALAVEAELAGEAPGASLLVLDAFGDPVSGARVVSLDRSEILDGRSDGDGRVEFESAAELEGEWLVLAPGSLPARRSLAPRDAGKQASAARLVLPQGTALTGRIVDTTGLPLGGRHVELDVDRFVPGIADRVPPELFARVGHGRRASTTTAGDGSFRFERLPTDWSGDLWVGPDLEWVEPRANERDGRALHLSRPSLGLHLVADRVRTVEGRVLDGAGHPVEGVLARLWFAGRDEPFELKSRRDGRFSRRLGEGERGEVLVVVEGETRRFAALPEDGELGEFVVDAPAAEAGGTSVELRVIGADETPLQGVLAADLGVSGPAGEVSVSADSGTIEIMDVTGAVFATVEPPFDPGPVVVHAPEGVAPLRLLTQDADGAPLVGTVFTLEREGTGRTVHSRAWLDGRATFGAVQRGGAEVHVVVQKHGFVPQRVALSQFHPSERDDVDAMLVLDLGHPLGVRFVDDSGHPLAVDSVRVEDVRGLERRAVAESEGWYRLSDLPRGAVELQVVRGNETRAFTARSGEGARVTLTW